MKREGRSIFMNRQVWNRLKMTVGECSVILMVVLIVFGCTGLQKKYQQEALVTIEEETGLKTVAVPDTDGEYLGTEYRGYRILFTGKAGDIWGRYAARLTMGEIGREVGGVMAFLTSSYEYAGNVTGSPLDRLLADVIGQPISITMILVTGKPNAPRLDIVGDYANVLPEEKLPNVKRLGIGPGTIYTRDQVFAQRLIANTALMDRMDDLWGAYIRVDGEAVSLFWAGQEVDFSRLINDHGGYYDMLRAFMNDLADIADAIPTEAQDRAEGVE
jgi:hypothetical protein